LTYFGQVKELEFWLHVTLQNYEAIWNNENLTLEYLVQKGTITTTHKELFLIS